MKLTEEQRELVKTIIKMYMRNEKDLDIIFHDQGSWTGRDMVLTERFVNSRFCVLTCMKSGALIAIDLLRQGIINVIKVSHPLMFSVDDTLYVYIDSDWASMYIHGGLFVRVVED